MPHKNIPDPMKNFLEGPEVRPTTDEAAKAVSNSGFDSSSPVMQTSGKGTPTNQAFKPIQANNMPSAWKLLAGMIGAGLVIYGIMQLGLMGSTRRCIGFVGATVYSCSDCDPVSRKTLFNEKNPKMCRGVQNVGGDRCVLACE